MKALHSITHNKSIFKIIENAISLVFIKGFDMITHLLVMPFLIKTIGIDLFGTVSFYLIIIQYFNLISDFGLNFSATKNVSINRENINKINIIFTATTFIRLIVGAICLFILGIIYMYETSGNQNIYLFIMANVIGYAIFPVWLFQGFENMKLLGILKLISRFLYIPLIFIFITDKQYYSLVILFESLTTLITGIMGFVLAFIVFKVKIIKINFSDIIIQFKSGSLIFLSSIFITLNRNSNIFILGLLTNNIYVGYYAVAEKIVRALQAIIEPITSAIYPYVSKRFSLNNITNNIKFIFKFLNFYIVGALVICLFCFISAPLIMNIFGVAHPSAILDLRVMSFAILFGILNYFIGIIGLVNLGFEKHFLHFLIISSILAVSFNVFTCNKFKDLSASISLVIGELTLFFSILIFLIKKSASLKLFN